MRMLLKHARSTAVGFAAFSLSFYLGDAAAAQSATGGPPVAATVNTSPKTGYDVAVRFSDLPNAIERLAAWAHYEVSNRDCVPLDLTRAPGGVRLPPEERKALVLERQSGDGYAARVHQDAFLNTDLFGLGVCRWALQSMTISFESATTKFVGGATFEQLRDGVPVTRYYLVRDFHARPAAGDFVFGERPDFYQKSLGPQFTLKIEARPLK